MNAKFVIDRAISDILKIFVGFWLNFKTEVGISILAFLELAYVCNLIQSIIKRGECNSSNWKEAQITFKKK